MDDRRSEEDLDAWEEPKEEVVAPETGVGSSVHSDGGGGCNIKPTYSLDSSPLGPSAKKSRRSVQKRVVMIPVGETEGFRQKNGAGGEVFPPTDSWAWRKYGQKPIKGSPYPRGYYRCSSCKGCPARKQVERSRLDPTTLVVTYSFDHNHPWPLPKNARHHTPPAPPPEDEAAAPPPSSQSSPSDSPVEQEEKYPHVIGEQEPALMIDDGEFRWFANVASPSSTSAGSDDLLYGSVLFGVSSAVGGYIPEEREVTAAEAASVGEGEAGEEDSLFAGLEELPEYSVVLRRGLAAASWFGTTA